VPSLKRAFGLTIFALSALGLISVAVALRVEERDAFCASCHTEPETSYVGRSQGPDPSDLASFHAAKDVPCILCHSRPGLVGRVTTLPLAAWDGARFFAGAYHQPARLRGPLHDGVCLQCHAGAVEERGFANHFHSELAAAGKGPTTAGCATCHTGHVTTSDTEPFLLRTTLERQCNACHRERDEGPSDFRLRRSRYAPAVRRAD